jgi:heme-degrading monooxygenase HmoA
VNRFEIKSMSKIKITRPRSLIQWQRTKALNASPILAHTPISSQHLTPITLMSQNQSQIVETPEPPYWAVIFTSNRTEGDRGYGQMAERMAELAAKQPGFLGAESVRGPDGFGITVSYWSSAEAITAWRSHMEHRPAQEAGKRAWYGDFQVRVAKVERAYGKASKA